jgi:hypothetical protein
MICCWFCCLWICVLLPSFVQSCHIKAFIEEDLSPELITGNVIAVPTRHFTKSQGATGNTTTLAGAVLAAAASRWLAGMAGRSDVDAAGMAVAVLSTTKTHTTAYVMMCC